MKRKTDPLATELAKLALKIAEDANHVETATEDRLDAFKALTTYHVNVTKINAKIDPDEDENASNFNNYRNRLKEVK